jgi:hypothetical protein
LIGEAMDVKDEVSVNHRLLLGIGG